MPSKTFMLSTFNVYMCEKLNIIAIVNIWENIYQNYFISKCFGLYARICWIREVLHFQNDLRKLFEIIIFNMVRNFAFLLLFVYRQNAPTLTVSQALQSHLHSILPSMRLSGVNMNQTMVFGASTKKSRKELLFPSKYWTKGFQELKL